MERRNRSDDAGPECWLEDLAEDGRSGCRSASSWRSACRPTRRRDPRSTSEPAKVDGGFLLRGSIDLVERQPRTKMPARHRSQDRQESHDPRHHRRWRQGAAAGAVRGWRSKPSRTRRSSRAGCRSAPRPAASRACDPARRCARRRGLEVLEIIDRAIERGTLAARPGPRGLRAVATSARCAGRDEETRTLRKGRPARRPRRVAEDCRDGAGRPTTVGLITEALDDTLVVEAAAGTGKTTELVKRMVRLIETGRAAHRADRRRSPSARRPPASSSCGCARNWNARGRAAAPRRAGRDAAGARRAAASKRRTSAPSTASARTCCASGRSRRGGSGVRGADRGQRRTPVRRGVRGLAAGAARRPRRGRPPLAAPPRRVAAETRRTTARSSGSARRPRAAAVARSSARWTRPRLRRASGRSTTLVGQLEDVRRPERRARSAGRQLSTADTGPAAAPARTSSSSARARQRRLRRMGGGALRARAPAARPARAARAAARSTPGRRAQPSLDARDALVARPRRASAMAPTPIWRRWCTRTCGSASRDYEQRKQKAGALDFLDLLIRARDLVRDDAAVRREFQRALPRTCSSTSSRTPIRCRRSCCCSSPTIRPASDRRAAASAPGALFIVGDPKQSIYRFRRADVGVYRGICERLAKHGATRVTLQTSFRSVPAIQRAVNAAFSAAHDRRRASRCRPTTSSCAPAATTAGAARGGGPARAAAVRRRGKVTKARSSASLPRGDRASSSAGS